MGENVCKVMNQKLAAIAIATHVSLVFMCFCCWQLYQLISGACRCTPNMNDG